MNIGTQTASLINGLYGRMVVGEPEPVVGMGATILMWTDRDAATITQVIELKSEKFAYEIGVVRDKETWAGGVCTLSPGSGPTLLYRKLRDGGQWIQQTFNDGGKPGYRKGAGNGLRIGERDSYRDPSF